MREAVLAAAEGWRLEHRLPQAPLSFEGPDGRTLSVQQYVGVVEAGGVCVEIYPKLDSALVSDPDLVSSRASTVMANLLWLLEESGYAGLVDAGDASVDEVPDSISDLLAWLFARRLKYQLSLGMPHEYVGMQDDLPLVRGRVDFARHSTVLFGRPDVIACAWDEFTPDTPLPRLLRCATELLLQRVRLTAASADLRDAVAMLDDVTAVHPLLALSAAPTIRWSRLNARWRPCHDLASAVLRGLGREMHAGSTESFVFLLDMNQLFESYCTRWIERRFGTVVQEQVRLGTLFVSPSKKLGQDADFVWLQPGEVWVGDAKYKRAFGDDWPKVEDVRQLICYGQLAAKRHLGVTSRLMLLHPTTGGERAQTWEIYDDQKLTLQSVCVIKS